MWMSTRSVRGRVAGRAERRGAHFRSPGQRRGLPSGWKTPGRSVLISCGVGRARDRTGGERDPLRPGGSRVVARDALEPAIRKVHAPRDHIGHGTKRRTRPLRVCVVDVHRMRVRDRRAGACRPVTRKARVVRRRRLRRGRKRATRPFPACRAVPRCVGRLLLTRGFLPERQQRDAQPGDNRGPHVCQEYGKWRPRARRRAPHALGSPPPGSVVHHSGLQPRTDDAIQALKSPVSGRS
jgi:hypothetical protein